MSKHQHHRRHINNSKKSTDNKSTFDINTIANLLNNIKPDDLSALLSTLNLGGSKTVSPSEVTQDNETPVKPAQTENQNSSKSNPTLDLLTAIKPLLTNERGQTLDKMLKLYSIGNILKK